MYTYTCENIIKLDILNTCFGGYEVYSPLIICKYKIDGGRVTFYHTFIY